MTLMGWITQNQTHSIKINVGFIAENCTKLALVDMLNSIELILTFRLNL